MQGQSARIDGNDQFTNAKGDEVEHLDFITIGGAFVMVLLGIISFFLKRIVDQYDTAQKNHNEQFDKLLKKFDVLTEIIYEHKNDVEVIKTQIAIHNDDLKSLDHLYDRMRVAEADIAVIKVRVN